MRKEFLSIKEFAAAAGVSQQSIYKRLSNENDELQQYLKVIDSKKCIDIKALTAIYNMDEPQDPKESAAGNFDNTILEMLKLQLEEQRKDIEEKNKQISDLMNRLAEANSLISQQQQLHLLDKQKILKLESAAEEKQSPPQPQSKVKNIFRFFKRGNNNG